MPCRAVCRLSTFAAIAIISFAVSPTTAQAYVPWHVRGDTVSVFAGPFPIPFVVNKVDFPFHGPHFRDIDRGVQASGVLAEHRDFNRREFL